MSQEETLYNEVGRGFADAVAGKMFGKSCYKTGSKAFMSFFQSCAVFKLPPAKREKALAMSGASLFAPSGKGRPMKEWVQLPFTYGAEWKRLATAAFEYVKATAE